MKTPGPADVSLRLLHRRPLQTKHAGFTLIELMIVVAIAAILATVAVPSYIDYIKRSRESAAQQWLMEIVSLEAQYLVNTKSYATLSVLGMDTPPDDVGEGYGIELEPNKDCADNDSTPGYCLIATPKTGSQQAGKPVLKVDNNGYVSWQ